MMVIVDVLAEGDAVAAVGRLLDGAATSTGFSGVALIAREGSAMLQRAYGFASRGLGVANRMGTVFNIGSMTKMFTAVALMQLAERGQLAFDQVISTFLRDYPREVADRVTIEHLLTHTSGMGSFWNAKFEAARTSLRTVSDHLPLFVEDPLAFEPGERFGYSNAGYIVLGAIIEAVSGMTYDTYLQERIWNIAGMRNTGAWGLDEDVPNRAIGYVTEGESPGSSQFPRTNITALPVRGSSAGGTYSTAHDLLRFGEALRQHDLLNQGSTETLLRPRVKMGPGNGPWYAYGFGCHTQDDVRIVGHNGGAPGVGGQLDLYLDSGYASVMLSNYDGGFSMSLIRSIRETLTRAPVAAR